VFPFQINDTVMLPGVASRPVGVAGEVTSPSIG
ncbi:uncharacterized protein METZ01_LOCUS516878, partial [marine metagenome]